MIIAITGSIGCGKSCAAEVFSDQGFDYINADYVGHELYLTEEVKQKVVNLFDKNILTNNEIDRKKLKEIVFYDAQKLKELNALVHPLILEEIKKKTVNKQSDIVIEAALAIEAGWNIHDILVLITCDEQEQVKRLLQKGKYSEQEIRTIIKSQLPQDEKISSADYIIDNSGTKEELKNNVQKLIETLSKKRSAEK